MFRAAVAASLFPMVKAEANSEFQVVPIEATVLIEAGSEQSQGGQVEIIAYNGGPLIVAGYRHPVYLDMTGGNGFDRQVPMLYEHDKSRKLGFLNAKVVGNKIEASGKLAGQSADRAEVEALAKDGYQWQASVGAMPMALVEVKAGEKATVNGQQISGPAYVARKWRLREISLVTIGADAGTQVSLAASGAVPVLASDPIEGGEPKSDTITEIIVERKRRDAIEAAAVDLIKKGGDIDAIQAEMATAIESGMSSKDFELSLLRKHARGPHIAISSGGGRNLRGDAFANAVEAAALKSMNWTASELEKHFDNQTLEATDRDNRLKHGLTLKDIFILAAEEYGIEANRNSFNSLMRVGQREIQASGTGLTTFSLAGILSNIANKSIKAYFESFSDLQNVNGGEKLQAYAVIGAVGSVNDFKTRTSYSLTADLTYQKVAPGGELKQATLGEQSYTNRAETYGLIVGIDRRDIVNDDLGAFNRIGQRLGLGAARTIAQIFWTEFFAGHTSGFTAFPTDNSKRNYVSGAAFGIDGLSTMEQRFDEQTTPEGGPLGVSGEIVLVPPALGASLAVINSSAQIVSGNTGKTPANNPHAGKWRGYKSPYLSNAAYGNSSLIHYMLADPAVLPFIETVFLNGKQTPTIETDQADFNQLGVQMRGYHDFGCAKQEYRAAVKSAGA